MLRCPERWLLAHWRWRFATWMAAFVLMHIAAQALRTGFLPHAEGLTQMREAVHEQQQLQQVSVRQLVRADFTAEQPASAAVPFSALKLSRESHSTLVSWAPGTPHSVLTLEVGWPQLPTLFALLGKQHVEPEGAILQMREQVLTLTLHLGERE